MDRKTFLQILGLTGTGIAAGCKTDTQRLIIPYIIPPENIVPGIADWYASTCRQCPAGCGILVKTREGRAVKVEGNPEHPVNKGKLCARGQASLQELYNPDRLIQAQVKSADGNFVPVNSEILIKEISEQLKILVNDKKGNWIAFISELNSGSLSNCMNDLASALGAKTKIVYEAINYSSIKNACGKLFNQYVVPKISLLNADLILCLNADILETYISPVEFSLQLYENSDAEKGRNNVFIYAGPNLGITGNMADQWIKIPAGGEKILALSLLNQIVKSIPNKIAAEYSAGFEPDIVADKIFLKSAEIKILAERILKSKNPVVLGGLSCDEETQIALMLINYLKGSIGKNIYLDNPLSYSNISNDDELDQFIIDAQNDKYDFLFIVNTNPVFTLPGNKQFVDAIKKIKNVVVFTPMMTETAEYAKYILPINTTFEEWGMYKSDSCIYNYQQPVMESVFGVSSTGDYLLKIYENVFGTKLNGSENFYNYIQKTSQINSEQWVKVLGKGFEIKDKTKNISYRITANSLSKPKVNTSLLENIVFITVPSYKYYDGRNANSSWLNELPDAYNSIVWDNYLMINEKYGNDYGIKNYDIVELKNENGNAEYTVKLTNNVEYHSAIMVFGLGHKNYGRGGTGIGYSPIPLLNENIWEPVKVNIRNTGRWNKLVSPSDTDLQYRRNIAQSVLLSQIGKEGKKAEHLNMYPEVVREKYRWGMTVDLDKCIGCGACVVACFAENNIPTVGKELVAKGREMHWIRIERYREEDYADYGNRYIPMMCQHCENAPCEPVCPVYAAYHSKDGLNVQVYNRCIGTRYCSNNCPYKVRRFNWFSYERPFPTYLQLNPDVTVRDKGVMEKCTFCVQRIIEVRDKAKDERREVRDGEIQPACVQTCPTNALMFGNLLDENSIVSKNRNNPRAYRVLEEYNTRSAITYLRRVVKDEFRKA